MIWNARGRAPGIPYANQMLAQQVVEAIQELKQPAQIFQEPQQPGCRVKQAKNATQQVAHKVARTRHGIDVQYHPGKINGQPQNIQKDWAEIQEQNVTGCLSL